MSKKKKPGRVVGRRAGNTSDGALLAGDIGWFGKVSPAFKKQLLDQFGGEGGLREAMREACPICSAGGEHEHDHSLPGW